MTVAWGNTWSHLYSYDDADSNDNGCDIYKSDNDIKVYVETIFLEN